MFYSFWRCTASTVAVTVIYMVSVTESFGIESVIDTTIGAEYSIDDNISLAPQSDGNTSIVVISPEAKIFAKEKNWNIGAVAGLRNRNFSESRRDSDDVRLSVNGDYQQQRNIYDLDTSYDIYSSLNDEFGDFGTFDNVVERKRTIVSPGYTRLLTERSSLRLGYSNTDVDYDSTDIAVPYVTNTSTASLSYNTSQRSAISGTLQFTDYESKENNYAYESIITRLGLSYTLSETVSGSISYGTSRRDSIQRVSRQFLFFGNVVTTQEDIDFSDDGKVFSLDLTATHETGETVLNISRDDQVDSFGGVAITDQVSVNMSEPISPGLKLQTRLLYRDKSTIASTASFSDSESILLEPKLIYDLDKNWDLIASYRYVKRRFKTSSADEGESNRILVGVTYKFPKISKI